MSRFKRKRDKSVAIKAHSVRSFQAAETDRLLASWKWDMGFTSQDIATQLSTIRSRSRDMAKNNPHYRRFLQLVETNVVGEGFALKSMPHDGPPSNIRLDEQAAKFIEYHWWKWANNKNFCDATGRKTIAAMDRLNAKTWARDGEFFILIESARNPYGMALRVIRPDAVDEKKNTSSTDQGNEIKCGVEINQNGNPVAYYVKSASQNTYVYDKNARYLIRIPANRMIHVFTQEDEDQPRGVPWAHSCIVKLKMLEEYDKAEMTAARDEACSVRTYYATPGATDVIQDLTNEDNAESSNALMQDKEPGQSEVLPIGWRQEVHTPQHPNRELTNFKASMLKDIATGMSVEYANFANDWGGVSFSSVRVGTISERDMWMVLQDDFASQCKSPIFVAWLKFFLSMPASGEYPQAKYDKFAEHEWRGRRWTWVDPMKDMKAAETARKYGWKTDTQIAADMGQDWADNIEESKREDAVTKGTRFEGIDNPQPITDKDIEDEDKEDAKQTAKA